MKKIREKFILGTIWSTVILTTSILFIIIGYVVYNGHSKLSLEFLITDTKPHNYHVVFEEGKEYDFNYKIIKKEDKVSVEIENVRKSDQLIDQKNKKVKLEKGMTIERVDGELLRKKNNEEINQILERLKHPLENIKVRLEKDNSGIFPLILTTLFVIVCSLLISLPIGLFTAIYLNEYKIHPFLNKSIHFAIDSLAGIPSIIFGLFGFIFFCINLKLGISLLAGVLTVSIMLLPIIIKTIEESLIAVPNTLRESSYGLGASKSQTIFKIVLPTALPGIFVAIILSIGRIIGESAIFIFTAGTVAQFPSLFDKAATLTVHAYSVTKENNDIATACAIGIVIIVIILILNIISKIVAKKIIKE